jgi:hypothetical protein
VAVEVHVGVWWMVSYFVRKNWFPPLKYSPPPPPLPPTTQGASASEGGVVTRA